MFLGMLFMLLLKLIFVVLGVLISVAFLTLLERKILGIVGLRVGPNKVSFFGIFQPIFDAVKLSNKQFNCLYNFSFFFYYLGSILMLFGSFLLWFILWSEPMILSLKHGMFFFMLILALNSLNSIICGWSTFSKYSLIGSIRTLSQLISYEAVIYLCLFFSLVMVSSFSFYNYSFFFLSFSLLIIPYSFFIWIPSILAELNRTPYDFSEGESELVSGFNTEFGSSCFALIFLSEYSNIIFFSLLSSFLFLFSFFFLFFLVFLYFIIWIRSVLPRFRFDKLMFMAWKFFIPFLTLALVYFFSLIM